MTTKKPPAVQTIDFDLPDEIENEELEVSHIVKIKGKPYRSLAEPHQWHLLRSSTDPLSIFRAYVHPEDYPTLDQLFSSRKSLSDTQVTELLGAFMSKPTGHPTTDSADSSDT